MTLVNHIIEVSNAAYLVNKIGPTNDRNNIVVARGETRHQVIGLSSTFCIYRGMEGEPFDHQHLPLSSSSSIIIIFHQHLSSYSSLSSAAPLI
ncbi:unnamed protein product [Orchesella dallaii]|uniref:Uncharacterized protein n=1 Tax=Orchesella dallaii TaxID=48710 RepID=A0ABP1PTT8_9HEXA